MTASYRGIIEAPRWAGVPSALRDIAFMEGVDLKLDIDKGWVRETVRFSVTGESDFVRRFVRALSASINAYEQTRDQVGSINS